MRIYCVDNRKAQFINAFAESARARGFDLRLLAPTFEEPSAYVRFRSIYRHFSVNSISFELACFRRYFDILQLTREGDHFIIADSDLLINCTEKNLPRFFSECDDGLIGSVGVRAGMLEEDISPHFSYWNHSILRRFVDYLIAKYESDVASLQASFMKRQMLGNKRAAIEDMALLYMFVQDTGTPFINSNFVRDGSHIDHNLSMAEAANATFKMEFGFKAMRSDFDGIKFLDKAGEPVAPAIIHLQGRAKIASRKLQDRRLITARGCLAIIATMREFRRWLF